jgi:hypothetical protein
MSAVYFGDLKNTAVLGQTFVPAAALTADTDGAGVDMNLGDAQNCSALLNAGVYDIASTNETYAIKIQESDVSSSGFADITGATFTTKTAAGGDPGTAYTEMITFQRTKRYLRAVLDVGGTTPSFLPVVTFIERKRITGSGIGYQA